MDSAANDIAGFDGVGPGQLKGAARAALICACFGSAWMYWAVVLSGTQSPVWFSMVTVPNVALTLWAILRLRAFRHLASSPAESAHWMRNRKFFWLDSGIEWGLGGITWFVLARAGRPDLIPPALGVIIGLHFLPLAKIFAAKLYLWTGTIMVIAAIGSLLIPGSTIRSIAGSAGNGLTLWLTAVVILWRITRQGGHLVRSEI